jgi:DNA recombination protein RmuC
VLVAGPTTLAAILHGFQMNYRSIALAKQSSEVWKVLSAVRTEFGKYNDVVVKLGKQLHTAAGSVDEIGKRARVMDRRLKDVDKMPDEVEASRLLGLEQALGLDDGDDDSDASALVLPAARSA